MFGAQIRENFRKIACLIGSKAQLFGSFKKRPHVFIATPNNVVNCLEDLENTKTQSNLRKIIYSVLDNADIIFDTYSDELEQILKFMLLRQ